MGDPGKADLRGAVLRRRRQRAPGERLAAGEALAPRVLAVLDVALRWGSGPPAPVAAYTALGGEPPTGPLLAALAARGVPVLLPVLLDDGDLDWAVADASSVPGRGGTRSPAGTRLGPGAVAAAGAVVVPGVAGDRRGGRLGRGGGSYDRALARVPPGVPVLLLLFDDELVDAVPTEPHDRRVTHLVTPSVTLAVAQHIRRAGLTGRPWRTMR